MGASASKPEEDKALQLCRERKKFVRQALDGRCSLAAAHVTYIQLLKSTGTAVRKFVEPEGPVESSLYTSTDATPEPPALTERSLSQKSFSSPSISQRVDVKTFSLTPSPPTSSYFQSHHMRFRGFLSKKVEEKPPEAVVGTVTSSSTPQNTTSHSTEAPHSSPFELSSLPTGNETSEPWDFFDLFPPTDNQFSFQEGKDVNHGLENVDDLRKVREEDGIPVLEDEHENSSHGKEESVDSEDEFDEPSTETLVRSFENRNRVHEGNLVSASPMPSAASVASETEFLNGEKSSSPYLSPLKATPSTVATPGDTKRTPLKEDSADKKVNPKDFISSVKDIEFHFVKASESGKEVPRMLEANKLHFRPILPGKEGGSRTTTFIKACFSCGEDPSQVKEEPPQTSVKYLTWHRTTSSRSSSSGNPLGLNSKDDDESLTSSLFNNFCMNSGSHVSTLDRLYAWERKLYDEVKASELVRKAYDEKCRILRHLESKGESSTKIDKTRAVVKDLYSRLKVAIHRIDSISKRIEELRDQELQPQLEELIEGLSRMWEVMSECHKLQYQIISVAYNSGTIKISIQSESRRQITLYLENELTSLASSFTKWIDAQKAYLRAINNWLFKCVIHEEKTSRRKRRPTPPHLRNYGPPIFVTVGVWLEKLETLPAKQVSESIKSLAAEISQLVPSQERNQAKSGNRPFSERWKADDKSESAVNMLQDDVPEEWVSGLDRFRSSLVGFLSQLSNYAEASVKMYSDLDEKICDAKNMYNEKSVRESNHGGKDQRK